MARRVVTGLGDDGKARVVDDDVCPHVLTNERAPGFATVRLWATDENTRMPGTGTDPITAEQTFFPGPGESRFIVNVFPPGFGTGEQGPFMHATTTVDYGVVLSGELTLVLDSGDEVTLRATDTMVQNGTEHGWRNDSDQPAVAVFVIIGAEG